MSISVTKSVPSSVGNFHPYWQDTANVSSIYNHPNDGRFAYHDFSDYPSEGGTSGWLYFRNWNFNLPENSIVKEINLHVRRRATTTHQVRDKEVRLYHAATESWQTANFTLNFAKTTDWTDSDVSVYYNNLTWNKTWTESEINDPDFGFIISAYTTSPTLSSTAMIDFSEIEVVYHRGYSFFGLGGMTFGGSAISETIAFDDSMDGGVRVGGIASYPFPSFHVGTGGLVSAGSAEITTEISATGGNSVGGTAIISHIVHPEGGSIIGGEAIVQFTDFENGTGGVVVAGEAVVTSGIFGDGGVVVAGESSETITQSFDGSSGIVVSGEAVVDPIWGEGGIALGGFVEEAVVWADETESGGVVTGGLSLIIENEIPQGGMINSGYATVDRVITIPDWDLDLEGSQVVPPIDSTATAHAEFWYEPVDKNLSWRITFSGFEDTVTVAQLRQGAAGKNGVLQLDLFDTAHIELNTPTEITGMTKVDWQPLMYNLATGNLYLTVGDANEEIRTQLWHFGSSLGGEASVEPYYEITTGGVTIGGTALVSPIWGEGGAVIGGAALAPFIDDYIPEGGVVIGGLSAIAGKTIDATGGVVVAGESTVVQIEGSIVTSGGVVAGGEASESREQNNTGDGGVVCSGEAVVKYIAELTTVGGVAVNGIAVRQTVFNNIGSGGVVIAGLSPIGIGIVGTGGIVVRGTPDQNYISNPDMSGGVTVSGLAIQTFFDYFDGSGGARVGGRTIADKFKFYTEYKTGYCRALKSDNICKVENQGEQLLRPPGDQATELDPDRFRIENLPTWCELNKKLQPYHAVTQPDDCDAALAFVIKKRQKGIIPPKSGRSQIRDRGIAFSGETVDVL